MSRTFDAGSGETGANVTQAESLPKKIIRSALHGVALVVVSPLAAACWLEAHFGGRTEALFTFGAEFVSILPGMPGMLLRRAFYVLVLDECSPRCFIGFGSTFSHRSAEVGPGVYIGPYARVGSARIGANSLIGSRASLISGRYQHELDSDGRWSATSDESLTQIEIGCDAWIGEGAIVMNDVGGGSMVAAGAVVSNKVPDATMVGGNPARFVRKLSSPSANDVNEQTHANE